MYKLILSNNIQLTQPITPVTSAIPSSTVTILVLSKLSPAQVVSLDARTTQVLVSKPQTQLHLPVSVLKIKETFG